MPETNICRLCATVCHDYKQLYEDMEVYEITVKYFDPMFLNKKNHTAICFDCWCHIADFHNFQQNVLLAQAYFDEADDKGVTKQKQQNTFGFPSPGKKFNMDNPLNRAKISGIVNPSSPVKGHRNFDPPNELLSPLITIKKEVGVDEDGGYDPDYTNMPIKREIEGDDGDDDVDDNMLVPELLFEDNVIEPVKQRLSTSNYHNDSANDLTVGETSQRYSTAKELDRLISQWKPNLECRVCNKSYGNFSLLRNHFHTDHPKSEFYISCCERKFNIRSRLEEHLRLHIDPFKCEACGKQFRWKVTLTRHKRKCPLYLNGYSKNNDVQNTVPEDFTNTLRQMFSVDETRKYKCTYCDKSYTSKCSLREHMVIHTGKDLYSCQYCTKTFRYRSAWRVHQIREHPKTRKGQISQVIRAKKVKRIENAKKILAPLKTHNQSAHNVSQKTPQKLATTTPTQKTPQQVLPTSQEASRRHHCTLCDKSYTSKCSLREHMSLHTGQHLYSCQHCPKTFTYGSAWRLHQKREHTKMRKYPQHQNVKIIIKSSTKKDKDKVKDNGAVVERTTHSPKTITNNQLIRKFPCNQCDRSYLHAKSLREHMTTHFAKNRLKCAHCPTTFTYRSAWRLHQKRFHSENSK